MANPILEELLANARLGKYVGPMQPAQSAGGGGNQRPTLSYPAPVGQEGRLEQAQEGKAPWWSVPGGIARGNADMPDRPPGPAGWNWTPAKAAAWNQEVRRRAMAQEARKAQWEAFQEQLRQRAAAGGGAGGGGKN